MENQLKDLYESIKGKYLAQFALAAIENDFVVCDRLAEDMRAVRTVMKIVRLQR